MFHRSALLVIVSCAALTGCVALPIGPSVMVLPGTGKSFDQFRGDDAVCRQYGKELVAGVRPDQVAAEGMRNSAVAGALIGAAAGVAIGGGEGAAIGAGSGLLLGSAAGTTVGGIAAHTVQQRYDTAYTQCMYSKGNQIPVAGYPSMPQPHPLGSYPPPPPGFSPSAPRRFSATPPLG